MEVGDLVQVIKAVRGPDVCYQVSPNYGLANISNAFPIQDIMGWRGHIVTFGRVNIDFTCMVELLDTAPGALMPRKFWFCHKNLRVVTVLDLLAEV